MAANIPGYYYDPERRRYFKIEDSKTAPSTAAWSSENVKKRRLEDETATAALRRMNLTKNRIARSKVLSEPLIGGFFAREYGDADRDVPAVCFARGLLEKGQLPLADARWRTSSNVGHMYISGQDTKTGLCTAYATLDELTLISTYIPRDKNGRVHRRLLAEYVTPENHIAPYQEMVIPQISDIKYHESSNQILITSRRPSNAVSIWAFAPKVTEPDDRRPHWLLGRDGDTVYVNLKTTGDSAYNDYQANCVAPAPPGSPTVCVVGTNRGLTRWDGGSGYMEWVTPRSAGRPQQQQQQHHPAPGKNFRDVFALDFRPSDPNVLLFGGRPGRLFAADLRVSSDRWEEHVRLPGPVTHIRCLDEHRALVAGLNDHLSVYDLRFLRSNDTTSNSNSDHDSNPRANTSPRTRQGPRTNPSSNAKTPVLVFPQYRNRAHVAIGLDYYYDGGGGLVAAAHDDGAVALYSARSGRRLPCPAITDGYGYGYGQGHGHGSPVRSIQFRRFPGDLAPTLFVGRGSDIHAYSFGVESLGDEA
ncbi:hypothetical protein F5X99DRAFT_8807 [Biscogniauxia marginata]|nr:hypothetical protein F5X99DRAFT_8807 [Biscogniauxia marginata]